MLTEAEWEAIDAAGRLYTMVARDVIAYGNTRDADLAELTAAIHVIQHMIMAQAAARVYPGKFRLLGSTCD